MMKYQIELPAGFISDDFDKAKSYCEHYNCIFHKSKRGTAHNVIETDNPINFFWLGCNIDRQSNSSLTITTSEKYLGK